MDGTAVVGSLIEELTSKVSEYLLGEISVISNFRQALESLWVELENIKSLLKDAEGKTNSTSVCNWLEKLEDFLDNAVDIVDECQAAGRLIWSPIFRCKMGHKMKKLNEGITNIKVSAKYLKYVGSILDVNARLESNSQVRRASTLNPNVVHPVGMKNDIEDITKLVLRGHGPRVIAVVGMGGHGKTLLAQSVFNQKRVNQHFDHRFWVVVSQKFDLQNVSNQMGRPMKNEDILNKSFKDFFPDLDGKRCLFVFDDVWDGNALIELFGSIGQPIQSNYKILITTRHKKVATELGLEEPPHIHEMKNLSPEDSRELLCIHAFPDSPYHLPPPELTEHIPHILAKCGGSPLAIKTIGAYLARVRRLPNDWDVTFNRLNILNAISNMVLPSLKLSYEVLPAHLKPCFLYFSLFPKGIEIECEYLVYMWIGQGLVSAPLEDACDVGRSYIEELIDRCLLEVSQVGGDGRVHRCKIHDLLHDLAVSETVKQTKCLLSPLEKTEELSVKTCQRLRRISVIKNHISSIKEAIHCPGLRTLLLSENLLLTSISASFFNNLTHLRVLDLSQTGISSLPKSIGKLKHLKFLNLSQTNIKMLPEFLTGLIRLQYLNVSHCSSLSKLHSGIVKHKFLQYLNTESCGELKSLAKGIKTLCHLQTLKLKIRTNPSDAKTFQFKDLKDLTLLQHLSLAVESPTQQTQLEKGIFGGMKKMRRLSFVTTNTTSHLFILPEDMAVMEPLEAVRLSKCVVPKWIFGLQNLMDLELEYDDSMCNVYKALETIANLKRLQLLRNDKCIEFPKEFGESMAFPKLEELIVERFSCLETFPRLQDTAMPMLKYFRLRWCDSLRNIPEGLGSLKSLEEVELLREGGGPDLWEGEWLRNLQKRHIKLKVRPSDQTKIDEIESSKDQTTVDEIDSMTTANDNALQWWYSCCTVM